MLYDLYRETRMATCALCRDELPERELETLDGLPVCENCVKDACDARADALRAGFIAAHEAEFYLDYWWGCLPPEERLRLAKQAYRAEAEEAGIPDIERDFCTDHEDWTAFAKGRLVG